MIEKIRKIEKELRKQLDSFRYEHTLGVMYTAAALSMRYQANLEQAMIAGLLHDCAKSIPAEEKIDLCRKNHLPVSEIERENPSLLHAKLGAFLAKEQYGVNEPEILNAIESHTTGKPEMNILDKIIYIADYIEPGRKALPGMEEIRGLAFTDIDECLYLILENSLAYLSSRSIPLDPMTEKTYYYYRELLGKEKMV